MRTGVFWVIVDTLDPVRTFSVNILLLLSQFLLIRDATEVHSFTACKWISGTSFQLWQPCWREGNAHVCVSCRVSVCMLMFSLVMPNPLFPEKNLGKLKSLHYWFLLFWGSFSVWSVIYPHPVWSECTLRHFQQRIFPSNIIIDNASSWTGGFGLLVKSSNFLLFILKKSRYNFLNGVEQNYTQDTSIGLCIAVKWNDTSSIVTPWFEMRKPTVVSELMLFDLFFMSVSSGQWE